MVESLKGNTCTTFEEQEENQRFSILRIQVGVMWTPMLLKTLGWLVLPCKFREYKLVVNVCYAHNCNRDNQSMTYLKSRGRIYSIRSGLLKKLIEIRLRQSGAISVSTTGQKATRFLPYFSTHRSY